ncbi:MAG TPA: hypothetical protein VGM19_04805 [Armatimonadota bacterium]
MRRSLLFVLCLTFAALSGAGAAGVTQSLAPAAATPNLLGYGKLALALDRQPGGGVATFTCADATRAAALASKLRADFSWDPLLGAQATPLTLGGRQVSGFALPGAGVALVAQRGDKVYVVSGADAAAVVARATALKLDLSAVKYDFPQGHSAGLDYFDLSALRAYYSWRSADYLYTKFTPEQLAANDKFARDINLQTSFQFPFWGVGSEAGDGAFDTYAGEYEVRRALRNDRDVEVLFGPAEMPWWLAQRFPEEVSRHDPYILYGVWGGVGEAGARHMSYWASEPAFAYAARFTQEIYRRYQVTAGDRLAAAAALFGRPGVEAGAHHMSWDFLDYSPAAQRGFRTWLRDIQGYTLAQVSERYYGDAKKLTSWEQVTVPSVFSFFGGFGERDTFNLLTNWRWRPDSPAAQDELWYAPDYTPGAEWTTVDLPPSQAQLFLPRPEGMTSAWMRQEFDPTAWLEKNKGQELYLVANTYSGQAVEVYLNGDYLGQIKSKQHWGPIGMKVTLLLRPGRNVLTVKVAEGQIAGPVYLTTQQPAYYPYLGKQQNARWADLREFQGYSTYWGHKRVFTALRQVNPDLPFKLYGVDAMLWDYYTRLMAETGVGGMQFTGSGSSYQPWPTGLGLADGFYGTSEEGGQYNDVPGITRELSWILFGGEGSHVFYYDESLYKEFNDQTHWFDNHQRLLALVGKAQRVQPSIAVLHSSRNERYMPSVSESFAWGIDRGILQSLQFDNVVVTDREVLSGAVQAYPVLFDTNTTVMDDAELKALEAYIRAGGTFIALHGTGRHSITEPDTWGISRLTGCQVLGERVNRLVTVLPDNPLLKRLAGMSFPGNGLALDYRGVDHAGAGTVALAPLDKDQGVVPIATWEDGTIAVAMRQLGKGRIIVLGSTFWTATSDLAGNGLQRTGTVNQEFLRDILAGVGVTTPIDADQPLWVRHFVTKNGLQDWYMAYNSGGAAGTGLKFSFAAPQAPRELLDAITGKPTPFTYAAGRVTVANLDLQPQETRVFALNHGTWVDAAESWYRDKVAFRKPYPPPPAATTPLPPAGDVVVRQFKVQPRTAADLAWTQPAFDDAAWQNLGVGYWNDLGLKVTGDTVLYRTHFRAPADWAGRSIMLYLTSFDSPVIYNDATFYLNGTQFATHRGHGWNNMNVLDTQGLVKPGDNVLAFSVKADADRPGGTSGVMFFRPEERLQNQRDLTAGWMNYLDQTKSVPAALPGKVQGRSLRQTVDIPADWAGQPVYLHIETPNQWLATVVINGQPIDYDQSLHPWGARADVRLDPYVHPGPNTLELWSFSVVGQKNPQGDMAVIKTVLGTAGARG